MSEIQITNNKPQKSSKLRIILTKRYLSQAF